MIHAAHLKTNRLYNPNSLTPGKITFTWTAEGGRMQTAFSVTISSEGQTVYDSGIITGKEYRFSPDFESDGAETYEWKITLYDADGEAGETAEGSFATVIGANDWTGKWIDPEPGRTDVERPKKSMGRQLQKLMFKTEPKEIRYPASYLKKQFEISQGQLQKSNRLYITAHGIYTVYLNGKEIMDFVLAPGFTGYNEILNVQAYDIDRLLQEGRNEIVVCLCDGWYRGSMNNERDLDTFGTDIALLCEVHSGKEVVCCSDHTWMTTKEGPLGQNDLQLGEHYDASRELEKAAWTKTVERDFSFANLTGSDCQPVREQERFKAKLITTPKGEKVLDFGQNFAGYVEMKFSANGGEELILTHGETLDKDGNFTQKNIIEITKPAAYQQVFYRCKAGDNFYHPVSCFFGFRYVKVESEMEISPEWFTGVALYSDMEQTAAFECGNQKVNQLFSNSLWSMKSNFLSIMTDCPTRARSGYTGDAQIFCPTGMYLMDCYPVYMTWLSSLQNTFLPDGGLKMFAPEHQAGSFMDSTHGWCDAIVIIPYLMWKRSGDIGIAESSYNGARKWVDFALKRAAGKTGSAGRKKLPKDLQAYFADQGFGFGEWLEASETTMASSVIDLVKHIFFGDSEVGTAYLYYSCRLLSEMAFALGKKEEGSYYETASAMAKQAYRAFFTDNGKITEEKRQCRYVRPMALGLLSEEEKRNAAAQLAELIRQNGNHLNTGFLSTAYICRMLSDYGETKTAYDLLLQEACPSWLYEVNKGATTVWESWSGINEKGEIKSSFNHYSLGAVTGWLMDSVCGIRVTDGQITIMPRPDARLKYANGAYDSSYGRIESGWRCEENQVVFRFVIPTGMTARILLPDGGQHVCESGEHQFICKN